MSLLNIQAREGTTNDINEVFLKSQIKIINGFNS
jgi:hypothetical protein